MLIISLAFQITKQTDYTLTKKYMIKSASFMKNIDIKDVTYSVKHFSKL